MINFNTIKRRIEKAAREELKEGLVQCTDAQKYKFIRMYSENLKNDFRKVVDSMPAEKLDRAMEQVQRTLDKNNLGI